MRDGEPKVTDPIRLLADQTFALGESPVWDDRAQVLYWVDIKAATLHRLDPLEGTHDHWVWPEIISCCGLTETGQILVGGRSGLWVLDPATRRRELAFPIPKLPDDMRTNDGKVGPDGAFWISTMQDREDRGPLGEVMRIDRAGNVRVMVTELTTPNGMEWAPNGRIFHLADTRELWVDHWDCDPISGALENRRRFLTLTEGKPDGAAMDVEGGYWIAGIYSGKIHTFSATGRQLRSVAVPADMVTMPCFGGADMKTVFVTSLTRNPGGNAADGGLFAVNVDVPGLQPRRMTL
jgi:sugar lactone lactonase YvrE